MFTFYVRYLGSTEVAGSNDEHLRNYAQRCFKFGVGINDYPICYHVIDYSESFNLDAGLYADLEEARAAQEKMGWAFFATEEEAEAQAKLLLEKCRQMVFEAYGQYP